MEPLSIVPSANIQRFERIEQNLNRIKQSLNSLDPTERGDKLLSYNSEAETFAPRIHWANGYRAVEKATSWLDRGARCTSVIEGLEHINKLTKAVFADMKDIEFTLTDTDRLKAIEAKIIEISGIIENKSRPCVQGLIAQYHSLNKETDKLATMAYTAERIFANIILFQVLIHEKNIGLASDLKSEGRMQELQKVLALHKSVSLADFQAALSLDDSIVDEGLTAEEFLVIKKPDPNGAGFEKHGGQTGLEAYIAIESIIKNYPEYISQLRAVRVDQNGMLVIPLRLIESALQDEAIRAGKSHTKLKIALKNMHQFYRKSDPVFMKSMPARTCYGDSEWKAISLKKCLGSFEVLHDAITPTSSRQEHVKENNHLCNFKYQVDAGDSHIAITCGIIDTQAKAEEFVKGLLAIINLRVIRGSEKHLRIVLHQLNSFATEKGMILEQHKLSRFIELKIRKELGAIPPELLRQRNIVLPPPQTPLVAHINTALNIATQLPGYGEDAISAKQNLEGLTALAVWALEEVKVHCDADNIKITQMPELLKTLEEMKAARSICMTLKDRLESNLKDSESESNLTKAQDKMAQGLKSIARLSLNIHKEISFKDKNDPSIILSKVFLKTISLVLAKQLNCLEELGETDFSRVTEIELHLLLDMLLHSVTEINCKSGLDRTGFVRSLWDALKWQWKYFKKGARETLGEEETMAKAIAFEQLYQMITSQDAATSIIDQLLYELIKEKSLNFTSDLTSLSATAPQADFYTLFRDKVLKNSLKESERHTNQILDPLKYHEIFMRRSVRLLNAFDYQQKVAASLIDVAQLITMESTGALGLKYGHDTRWGSMAANPHPLSRLPMFIMAEGNRLIRLYQSGDYVNQFGHYMAKTGHQLILRNSQLRGD